MPHETVVPLSKQTPSGLAEIGQELAFSRKLQAVSNKVHATSNIEQIIHEVSQDICQLFDAERIVIFLISDDKRTLVSRIKNGLNSYGDQPVPVSRLAVGPQSIPGFVAANRRLVNIVDVYDAKELQRIHPEIQYLRNVDQLTGYRTRQMLVFPVLHPDANDVVGVVQLSNTLSGLPFPPLMEAGAMEIAKTLAIAFSQRRASLGKIKTKFDLLVAENVLSSSELELAQRSARKKRANLEDVLIDEFLVDPLAIGRSLASFFGVPYEPFRPDRIKHVDLLKNLKKEYVLSNGWVPIDETKEEGLVIMTNDPESVRSSRIANNVFPRHGKITYRVCLNRDFISTVQQFYSNGASVDNIGDLLSSLGEEDEETGPSLEDLSAAQDNELVKLVNKIIIDAYTMGASDIHIEPYPDKSKLQVRLRRDGSLVPYIEIPPSYRNALVARVKIMADMDISERRIPQDGKIKFRKFGPLDVELRIATIPTAGGMEDIVMRILASGKPIPIDQLDLAPRTLEKLKQLVKMPYGLFLACGPTGSGKTTTLHSVMSFINTPENKIWTAEDPVEITQRGLRQVQINRKAGLNFASMMRSFLRADPDVIMVGEMRDRETVALGIEASLTGHLVLSTLHTNNAPESIVRLLDMGMDPFNFSDALLGILAQRLAKRLCPCRRPYTPEQAEIESLLSEYCRELEATSSWQDNPQASRQAVLDEWLKKYADKDGKFTLFKPVGCEKCNKGYRGRVGLFELLEGSDIIRQEIRERSRVSAIYATALEEGMRTLKQDGIEKVLQGITDMQQVRMVCIK
jgi:type II secretory ATPase GspE/PulE/Tfp pilus assembly ATPase PilB-like protein/GAF domain-containing protein